MEEGTARGTTTLVYLQLHISFYTDTVHVLSRVAGIHPTSLTRSDLDYGCKQVSTIYIKQTIACTNGRPLCKLIHLLNVQYIKWLNVRWLNIKQRNIERLNVETTKRRALHNVEKLKIDTSQRWKLFNIEKLTIVSMCRMSQHRICLNCTYVLILTTSAN